MDGRTTDKPYGPGHFFDSENQIFINRLNKMCKGYDDTEKAVKSMKRSVDDEIPDELERQRQALNDVADRCDYTNQKLATIETHLPTMISEVLEYYFDRKVAEHQSKLVTLAHFNEKMGQKLEATIFYNYEKTMANQKIEDNTFKLEERIHKLERDLSDYVMQDDFKLSMMDKASTHDFDELRTEFNKLQSTFTSTEDKNTKDFQKFVDANDKYKEELKAKFDDITAQLEDIDDPDEYDDDEDSEIDESELNDDFDVDGDFKNDDKDSSVKSVEPVPEQKKAADAIKLPSPQESKEEDVSGIATPKEVKDNQSSAYQASSQSSMDIASGVNKKRSRVKRGNTNQSQSDIESCAGQSKTSRSLTMRNRNKKASAMMIQQETLLNNIQEKLGKLGLDYKVTMERVLPELDKLMNENSQLMTHMEDDQYKYRPKIDNMSAMFDEIKRTQDAGNLVMKDSVEKLEKYNSRIGYLERIDLEKKLSELSRKLIAEIVKENLMPVQTNYNMELKAIKRVVDEQRNWLTEYKKQLQAARDEIADFKLSTVFELQNYKKEAETYMRELVRMQRLDRIRLQINGKQNSNPQFHQTGDFANASYLPSLDLDQKTEDSLFVSPNDQNSAISARRRMNRNGTGDSKTSARLNTVEVGRQAHSTQLSNLQNPGSTCTRANKPSVRNRVIMKSIDADTEVNTTLDSGLDTSNVLRDGHNNSIFGGNYRPRLALNQNTTIELAEPPMTHMNQTQRVNFSSEGKSPFTRTNVNSQNNKRISVQQRNDAIKKQVLKSYNVGSAVASNPSSPRKEPGRIPCMEEDIASEQNEGMDSVQANYLVPGGNPGPWGNTPHQ